MLSLTSAQNLSNHYLKPDMNHSEMQEYTEVKLTANLIKKKKDHLRLWILVAVIIL